MFDSLIKKPKTKKGEETLKRIFKAAEIVFEKNGYYNSSINEITSEAGVATGTFYIYFVDKMSLYRFMLETYSSELINASANASSKCKNLHEVQVAALRAYLNFVLEHKLAYKIILESLYIDFNFFKSYYDSFSQQCKIQLDNFKSAGVMKDIDTSVAAYALMGIYAFVGMKKIIFEDAGEITDKYLENVVYLIENGFFNFK